MEHILSQQVAEALQYVYTKLPSELREPLLGITCGSGLDRLVDTVQAQPRVEIDYEEIPYFPQSTGTK